MVIKSVPVDDMNTIVFAIRGSQTFMDWAVNLNSAPVSPGEFLVSIISFILLSELLRHNFENAEIGSCYYFSRDGEMARCPVEVLFLLVYELNVCLVFHPDRHMFQTIFLLR